jgi:hypothetical protein
MHAEYGRTLAREAVERAEKTREPPKAPSHTLGRARVNVHDSIHDAESVVSDLDMLWQELHFGYRAVSTDDMINILMGMHHLYKLRFARLKDEFEGYVREAKS